jgi:sugar O-acyltransferase (sialic acid O-acetyltransferase NeuD family)
MCPTVSYRSAGILGAGRQALETAGYCQDSGLALAFFVEEAPPSYPRSGADYGAPIHTFDEDLSELSDIAVVSSVGDPALRRRLVQRWPGTRYLRLLSGQAWISPDSDIGDGTIVAPLAAVNRRCVIGHHVLVNVGAIASHDVIIGDYSSIGPGCTIGGDVRVGQNAVLGIGCTIRDRITIGDGAIVGAGAVVVNHVPKLQTVVGVPARPIARTAKR